MKKNILISLALITISLIFLQVGVLPRYHQYNRLRNQWKENQQIFHSKQKYYSQLFTIKQKLNSYQDSVSKISSALPVNPDAASLYKFVQEKASENGLIIQGLGGLKMSKPTGNTAGIIKFNGVFSGSYQSLTSFLKAVENSSRLINVNLITLLASEDKKESGQVKKTQTEPRYTINLEANYYHNI